MAPINNIPFLSYLIFCLKKAGIKKVLILVGYKSKKIINYYKHYKNINISFCYSSVDSETGKRVLDAYKHLDCEFLLLYGDNFWLPNIQKMYNNFKKRKVEISTTIFNNKNGTGEYGKQNKQKAYIVSFQKEETP